VESEEARPGVGKYPGTKFIGGHFENRIFPEESHCPFDGFHTVGGGIHMDTRVMVVLFDAANTMYLFRIHLPLPRPSRRQVHKRLV
jgi:hypothetical protein